MWSGHQAGGDGLRELVHGAVLEFRQLAGWARGSQQSPRTVIEPCSRLALWTGDRDEIADLLSCRRTFHVKLPRAVTGQVVVCESREQLTAEQFSEESGARPQLRQRKVGLSLAQA
jgi:hypothetical protein